MLTKNINFINFQIKRKNQLIKEKLKLIIKENNHVIQSLGKNYKYSYNKNFMPPKNSFLDQLFMSYYPECLDDKRYGKSVMWRFLPIINYFYKLIYKIKIYRRNYEILKS